MALKTILCAKKHLNKITECLKMTTFKIVFTFDVLFSAETTMHCKVTCILYKKQVHFSQLFCLQVPSRYVFSCVICFRFIHFILISTVHALSDYTFVSIPYIGLVFTSHENRWRHFTDNESCQIIESISKYKNGFKNNLM
jgi:hypothetical protein